MIVGEGFVKEYFVRSVLEDNFRGQVRHEVFVVDHPVVLRQFEVDELGQVLVSDPGASKLVNFDWHFEALHG